MRKYYHYIVHKIKVIQNDRRDWEGGHKVFQKTFVNKVKHKIFQESFVKTISF